MPNVTPPVALDMRLQMGQSRRGNNTDHQAVEVALRNVATIRADCNRAISQVSQVLSRCDRAEVELRGIKNGK